MGTKMVPAYANLFMGKLEEKLKEFGKQHNIMLWKQFIDDIFVIWTGSTSEFTTYYMTNTIYSKAVYKTLCPTKRCYHACVICLLFETRCFAESITLKHKFPISLPHPKQFFNCRIKNVIYLVKCTTPGCRAQYVGNTTRHFIGFMGWCLG